MAAENLTGVYTRTHVLLSIAIGVLLALLVALIVMFFRLVTPPGAVTQPASPGLTWVRSLYGFGPGADQQLQSPSSVAIGPDGAIYVTDPIHARVLVFSPDGVFRRQIHTGGNGGKGQLLRPESVAVAANGDTYIADSWAGKVIVFDARGRFVREWPGDRQPRGIYVDGNRVYVLDVGEVVTYDTSGTRLSAFGTRGHGPNQIDAYLGIAARDGRIYVADSYNQRVRAFDSSGTLIWSTPATSTPRPGAGLPTTTAPSAATSTTPAGFAWDLPQDVAIDGNGDIVVVDAFRFDITVLDGATGRVKQSYGTYGVGEGQFYYPTSIAYDPRRDWFAVADTTNNRVQIVRIPGTSASVVAPAWRALSSPYAYLIVPTIVLLGSVGFAVWYWRRTRGLSPEPESADELLEDADSSGPS